MLVASYLDRRSFRLRSGIVLSKTKLIETVVSQASVLSQLLYNIYTSDILTQMENFVILTYADNAAIVLYSKHQNISASRLQRAADSILDYLARWRIRVNADKCL